MIRDRVQGILILVGVERCCYNLAYDKKGEFARSGKIYITTCVDVLRLWMRIAEIEVRILLTLEEEHKRLGRKEVGIYR
jgi:hypothetical protein